MKITKKAFIEAMTSNATSFCGVTKKLYTSDEVYCTIQELLKTDAIIENRYCEAFPKCLVFSGGSKLGFDQLGKYDFFKYEYPEGTIYICRHTYFDIWDEKDLYRCMYYLVKNKKIC